MNIFSLTSILISTIKHSKLEKKNLCNEWQEGESVYVVSRKNAWLISPDYKEEKEKLRVGMRDLCIKHFLIVTVDNALTVEIIQTKCQFL